MQEGSKYHGEQTLPCALLGQTDLQRIVATSWRTVPDYQGGFLLDGGVHFAAGLAAMLGPIAQVNGTSFLHRKHLAPTDTCYAICKTEGGVDGVGQKYERCRLEILIQVLSS